MKISDIVRIAAVLLAAEDVIERLDNPDAVTAGGDGDGADGGGSGAERELNLLTRCANLAVSAAASDYLPVVKERTVTASGNEIEYSQIDSSVIDVLGVQRGGVNAAFKMRADRLVIDGAGEYGIRYSVLPENSGLDGVIVYAHNKISPRVLAYGTACEYCIISGAFDEAAMWDRRFKDALQTAVRNKGEMKVKRRAWA